MHLGDHRFSAVLLKLSVLVDSGSIRRTRMMALAFWLVPLLWPVPDQASDPAVTTSHALRYIFGVWLGMIVLGVFLWRRTARQIARENQS